MASTRSPIIIFVSVVTTTSSSAIDTNSDIPLVSKSSWAVADQMVPDSPLQSLGSAYLPLIHLPRPKLELWSPGRGFVAWVIMKHQSFIEVYKQS
ncbi:hypothetical protein WG66_010734 [Moniliophthora roreri]|nr:hypothetical protein WG66_010734 [Moniliophthora roreri]